MIERGELAVGAKEDGEVLGVAVAGALDGEEDGDVGGAVLVEVAGADGLGDLFGDLTSELVGEVREVFVDDLLVGGLECGWGA